MLGHESVVKRSAGEAPDKNTKQRKSDKKSKSEKRKDRKKSKKKDEDGKPKNTKDKRNEFVDELMKVFQSSDRRIDILEEKIHRQTVEIGLVSDKGISTFIGTYKKSFNFDRAEDKMRRTEHTFGAEHIVPKFNVAEVRIPHFDT